MEISFAFGLQDNTRFFQKIIDYVTSNGITLYKGVEKQMIFPYLSGIWIWKVSYSKVKFNIHIFSESRGIVIAIGFCISKCF